MERFSNISSYLPTYTVIGNHGEYKRKRERGERERK